MSGKRLLCQRLLSRQSDILLGHSRGRWIQTTAFSRLGERLATPAAARPLCDSRRFLHSSTVIRQAEASENTTANEASDGPTPEQMAEDIAKHKAGLSDPDVPEFQNPLHHNNPDLKKVFPEDFDSQEEFEAAIIPAPPLEDKDGNIICPAYLAEIADEMVHLNMLEMNELCNKIADHFGFDDKMMSPDGDDLGDDMMDADASAAAAPVEEKTAFDVRLTGFDAKSKIKVIKEVRSIAGLGLKEAKEMVEGAPNTILKDVKQEQADEIKAKLEELGATVEIV